MRRGALRGERAAVVFIVQRPDADRVEPNCVTDPGFAEAAGAGAVSGICGSGIIEAVAEMFLAGLLTTDGVRDALEMRRGIREEQYNNRYTNVPPLVPRYLRRPVRGRLDYAGNEVEPLVSADVDEALALWCAGHTSTRPDAANGRTSIGCLIPFSQPRWKAAERAWASP